MESKRGSEDIGSSESDKGEYFELGRDESGVGTPYTDMPMRPLIIMKEDNIVKGIDFTSSPNMKIPQMNDTRTISVLQVPCATASPAFWTAYIAATPPGTQKSPLTSPQAVITGLTLTQPPESSS